MIIDFFVFKRDQKNSHCTCAHKKKQTFAQEFWGIKKSLAGRRVWPAQTQPSPARAPTTMTVNFFSLKNTPNIMQPWHQLPPPYHCSHASPSHNLHPSSVNRSPRLPTVPTCGHLGHAHSPFSLWRYQYAFSAAITRWLSVRNIMSTPPANASPPPHPINFTPSTALCPLCIPLPTSRPADHPVPKHKFWKSHFLCMHSHVAPNAIPSSFLHMCGLYLCPHCPQLKFYMQPAHLTRHIQLHHAPASRSDSNHDILLATFHLTAQSYPPDTASPWHGSLLWLYNLQITPPPFRTTWYRILSPDVRHLVFHCYARLLQATLTASIPWSSSHPPLQDLPPFLTSPDRPGSPSSV